MEGDILRGLIYQFVDYYGIQEGSCKNSLVYLIKDRIRVYRTGWIGPWTPEPIQEPVKDCNIQYFNCGKKWEVNSKH